MNNLLQFPQPRTGLVVEEDERPLLSTSPRGTITRWTGQVLITLACLGLFYVIVVGVLAIGD